MRAALLAVVALAACGESTDPVAGAAGACEPCSHTGECQAHLRCRAGLCVDEGMACGGDDDPSAAAPIEASCGGLCGAAADCDGLREGGELGGDVPACESACEGGSPSADERVLTCLIDRVGDGLCDDDSVRECLPPWAPHLAGGDLDCAGVACQCERFCTDAVACGMFADDRIEIDETGCASLCHNGELERPGALACAQGEVREGNCTTQAMMACFGLDDEGRPDDG